MVLQCPRLRIMADSDSMKSSSESSRPDLLAQPPHVGTAAERGPAQRPGQHRSAGYDDRREIDRGAGHQKEPGSSCRNLRGAPPRRRGWRAASPRSTSQPCCATASRSDAPGSPQRHDGHVQGDSARLEDPVGDVTRDSGQMGVARASGRKRCQLSRCGVDRRTRQAAGSYGSRPDECMRCASIRRTTALLRGEVIGSTSRNSGLASGNVTDATASFCSRGELPPSRSPTPTTSSPRDPSGTRHAGASSGSTSSGASSSRADFTPAQFQVEKQHQFDSYVGAAAAAADGALVVAEHHRLTRIAPDGSRTSGPDQFTDHPEDRWNDGVCDARGRFLVGTASLTGARHSQRLLRTDGDTTTVLDDDLGLANGIGVLPRRLPALQHRQRPEPSRLGA